MKGLSPRAVLGLRLAVLTLLTLHAFFSPVYEGPDEPFHLARARMFARAPLSDALAGQVVDADLVRSMKAWPCGPAIHPALGCPAFGMSPSSFNNLEPARHSALHRPLQRRSQCALAHSEMPFCAGYQKLAR